MKKFAILAAIVVSLVAVEAAQAGVFRRSSGGCSGGSCGMASAPAATATAQSQPAPAKETELATKPAPTTDKTTTDKVAETSGNQQTRYARTRLFGRRRG